MKFTHHCAEIGAVENRIELKDSPLIGHLGYRQDVPREDGGGSFDQLQHEGSGFCQSISFRLHGRVEQA